MNREPKWQLPEDGNYNYEDSDPALDEFDIQYQEEYNLKHINDGDWESGPVIVDVSERE